MSQERQYRIVRVGNIPDGWSRVIREEESGWSASLKDGGTLKFDVSEADPANGVIDYGQELAIEVRTSSGWEEPQLARFIVQDFKRTGDAKKIVEVQTAVDRFRYLAKGAVLSDDSSDTLEYSDTAGFLAWIAVQRAHVRGGLNGVTYTFDGSATSSGQPWQHRLDIKLEADQKVLEVLVVLRDQGLISFWTQGRELIVENAAYTRMTQTRVGSKALEVVESIDATDAATHSIIYPDEGGAPVVFVDGASPIAHLGRIEASEKASGVTDSDTIQTLGNLAKTRNTVKRGLTYTEAVADGGKMPHRDFLLGDTVQVRRPNGFEAARVTAWGLRFDGKTEEVDVWLADRRADLEEKLAARARALGSALGGNGRISVGSSSSGIPGRRARVVDSYPGYGPAQVVFAGETGVSGPYPFIGHAGKVTAGDEVMVIGSGSTYDTAIHGRIYPNPVSNPSGETVVLELGDGFEPVNDEIFGPLQLTLDSSGWVTGDGAWRWAGTGTMPDLAVIPETMRPSYYGSSYRWTNPAVRIESGSSLKAMSSEGVLSGFRYHIGTDRIPGSRPLGTDGFGETAWIAGDKTWSATEDVDVSAVPPDE